MFGDASVVVALLLLAFGALVRNPLLFLLCLVLLIALLVARFWAHHSLDGVEYCRQFSARRVFFGETIDLTIEVVNRKLLPLPWLECEDDVPRSFSPVSAKVVPSHDPSRQLLINLLSLRWYERVRRHYRFHANARGLYSFGPVRLRSGDIFGFQHQERKCSGQDSVLVYPKVLPLSQLGLPTKDPFGDLRVRHWLFEDPLRTVGVRDYTDGDSPRRIHWKATARAQNLQVKLYEPTTNYRLAIFLNLNTSGSVWWWQAYDPDLLELAIVTAASLANWSIDHHYQTGLFVNGRQRMADDKVKIAPSRDPEQRARILEALAKVPPFATMPLEGLLRLERRTLAFGATIVVVTAVLSPGIHAEMRALQTAGHRIALIVVGDHQLEAGLPGLTVHRVSPEIRWNELVEVGARRLP